MVGSHLVKSWCSTQPIVSLSSGEAEYYGIVKGASVGLGLRSILKDLGVEVAIRVNTDASAATGMANREGLGKVRHIEVNRLWIQDRAANGDIEIHKVNGKEHRADILTRHVNAEDIRVDLHKTGRDRQSVKADIPLHQQTTSQPINQAMPSNVNRVGHLRAQPWRSWPWTSCTTGTSQAQCS